MLMLLDRQCISFVKENFAEGMFEDRAVADIVQKIFEFYRDDREVSLPLLISECDEASGNLLSGLMTQEESVAGDRMKICRDCIQRLQGRHAREQKRRILAEMDQAKEQGDQPRLDDLTQEFNRLIKGV
jgi:hypothetical protein